MEFSELIRQFTEKSGVEMPEIVDEAAAFDADGMPFFLMRVANEGESEYLVIAADLGEPPPERLEKLYQTLLDAGHNFAGAGGGVLARNPGDGHIWLESREAFASMDVETAIAKVKSLGDAAIKWRDIIREYRISHLAPAVFFSPALRYAMVEIVDWDYDADGFNTLACAQGGMELGKVSYTCQFTVTGLGSGHPQIASVGFGQTIAALDLQQGE